MYAIIAIAEVDIPKAVLIKASEIPVESATASGAPAVAIAEKALIIPNTVPRRPIKVAIDEIVARMTRFFSSIGNSREVLSSISLLMASTFLPLVFNNLPPILRSHHLWTTIWIISLIFFHPKIFLNKLIVYVLAYGVFFIIAKETIWYKMDEWNFKRLLYEFYEIAIGVSVVTYFYQNRDYFRLAKLTKWSIVFLIITSIMKQIKEDLKDLVEIRVRNTFSLFHLLLFNALCDLHFELHDF